MLKLQVSGITCGGCAAAIERSLGAALPGAKVAVDVMTGVVEVGVQPAQSDKVKAAIEDAGFTVTGAAA
jgi:copper chaperone